MATFFTLLPLIFATSFNSANALYPSYEFCVHLDSESYIPCCTYTAFHNGLYVDFYMKAFVNVSGDLYFNSRESEYYVDNLSGNLKVELYTYDSNSDEFVLFDDYGDFESEIFNYDLLSSSGSISIPFTNFYIQFQGQQLFFVEKTPLAQNESIIDTFNLPTYVFPSSSERIGFCFDSSSVSADLRGLITNFVENGYSLGFNEGYNSGYTNGLDDGLSQGYQTGYTDGYSVAVNQDTTAAIIFTGILEVALLPVNVFLAIFNYEVFGINISGLVASLLTVAVVVIIIRVILAKSGGNGGGSK